MKGDFSISPVILELSDSKKRKWAKQMAKRFPNIEWEKQIGLGRTRKNSTEGKTD